MTARMHAVDPWKHQNSIMELEHASTRTMEACKQQNQGRGVTTIEAGEALASSILDRCKVNTPLKTGARSQ